MTNITPQLPLAAGGQDHHVQLRHLKAHLHFQAQNTFQNLRLSWNTVINKAQSRHHITQELHAKINAKATIQPFKGKMDTEEGQQHLRNFYRMITTHQRTSAGDALLVPWAMKRKMVRTMNHRLAPRAFQEYLEDRHPASGRPGHWDFPPRFRDQVEERTERDTLLKRQGHDPKKNRDAVVQSLAQCPACRLWNPKEAPSCSNCSQDLRSTPLTRMACTPGPVHQPILHQPA